MSEIFVFRKIWRAFFFRNTRFEIRPFALLPTNCELLFKKKNYKLRVTFYELQFYKIKFTTCIAV